MLESVEAMAQCGFTTVSVSVCLLVCLSVSVCLSVCLCLCLAASVPKMNCPPPQIPAKRRKLLALVICEHDTARLFWKGVRNIAADRVFNRQKPNRQNRKIKMGWKGCMEHNMAMANIGAERINEVAELNCMRDNDMDADGTANTNTT